QHPNRYIPVLFDFTVPKGKHFLETVTLLARLAKFIVADITDAAVVRTEFAYIVRDVPSVPIQPILREGSVRFTEFDFYLENFHSVLEPYEYRDLAQLLQNLSTRVISPAEERVHARSL